MQTSVRVDPGPGPATHAWLLPLLVAMSMLQSLVTAASLWALALFLAAATSGTLRDVLGVATALVGALLRLGLHVLFLA